MSEPCPNCGKVIVFSWPAGKAPSPETPLCSPIESPDCWNLTRGHGWENLVLTHRLFEPAKPDEGDNSVVVELTSERLEEPGSDGLIGR
jgi:hypothetical protein